MQNLVIVGQVVCAYIDGLHKQLPLGTAFKNSPDVLTTQCHFRTSDCSKQICIGNRDILSLVFED